MREDRSWGFWESREPVVEWNANLSLTSLVPLPPFQDLLREEEDEETKNNVPRIQCGDGCDPQGLKDNSQVPLNRCWCI